MPAYLTLLGAIICEVIATSALQASQQFTKPLWSLVVLAGYAGAFYLMSLTLKTMPVGIVYAVWSGLGIVLISLIGWAMFKQRLDLPAIAGISLIVAGVMVIQLFSKSSAH
jgi:small multidrug resistance pump